MKKCNIELGGKKISLNVVFDCYDDEPITDKQQESLELFEESKCFIDAIETPLVRYIKNASGKTVLESELVKYISPKCLYVCRENNNRKIAILCDSTFDEEHGIAIVFTNEKCTGIVGQDEIL